MTPLLVEVILLLISREMAKAISLKFLSANFGTVPSHLYCQTCFINAQSHRMLFRRIISDITLLVLTSFLNFFRKKSLLKLESRNLGFFPANFVLAMAVLCQDSSGDMTAARGRFVPGFFLGSTPVRSREAYWLWGRGKKRLEG